MEDNTIVCRCEDITLGQVRDVIAKGYTSLDEIKRILRCGMGPCQGKTCGQLILREISIATGKPMAELAPATARPPVKAIKLGTIAKAAGGEGHA